MLVNKASAKSATSGCDHVPGTNCAVPTGISNFESTNTYRVGDQVNALCQTNLNVWKFACKTAKYASIPYLLFNVDQFEASANSIKNVLTFKDIPLYHTISETGNSVKWGETSQKFPEIFLDGDHTSTSTFTARDIDTLRKFFVDDHVRIYTTESVGEDGEYCEKEETANVLSVDPQNLTITLDKTLTLKDGDRILRMYNLIETCGEFKNGVALDPTDYYEAFYQYFGGELCFTQDELNKCYASEGGVMGYINSKFSALYQDLFLQVGNAFWYGLNVREIANTQKSQTMGLLTGIFRQAQLGKTVIHDLSGKTTDQAKVKALLNIFMEAQACQIDGADSTLVVVGNHKFYNAVSQLNPAWNSLMGCIPVCDKSLDVAFEVKVINTIFGRVEMFADFFLQYYYPNKSFAVVMPKGLMALHMRENEAVTLNGAGGVALEKVQPGFKVVDLAPRMVGKVGCGTCIEVYTQHAHIFAGLGSGIYRVIEGLN